MLAAAYKGHQGDVSEKSCNEHEPQQSRSSESDQHLLKNVSSSSSFNRNSNSTYMFLATQVMCEIGSTLGQMVLTGDLSEREMYGVAAEYLGRFPSNLDKMDPKHLLACPSQVAALLQPGTREQLEDLIKESTANSVKCCTDKQEEVIVENYIRTSAACAVANEAKVEGHINESFEKAKGDSGKELKRGFIKIQPVQTATEKGEPFSSTAKVEHGYYSYVSASMIYDEGTNVDTGVLERTAIPPNFVFEINEAFSPRKERKQPEKKSSWLWKTGAAVAGVGLVGLAGYGLYKYLNN